MCAVLPLRSKNFHRSVFIDDPGVAGGRSLLFPRTDENRTRLSFEFSARAVEIAKIADISRIRILHTVVFECTIDCSVRWGSGFVKIG